MDDLISALTIFRRYTDSMYPTNCEHDTLTVSVDPASVSVADLDRLRELGFHASVDEGNFYSYRFGSN